MIRTKKELDFYIKADYMMNRGYFKPSVLSRLRSLIFPDYIMNYLVHMRKADYYSHLEGGGNVIGSYHRMKQRKLGIKLGFSIACDAFGYGLVIPHYGTIVVGGDNKIGNYAVLHTSTCITNGKKIIGDGLYVSTGAKLTTLEHLGNNIMIAANSVVTKSCDENGVLLAGMPASVKKKQDAWYSNNERYISSIQKIEKLRETLHV